MRHKYNQKLLDSAKKYTIKTASKREIQKTAEATGDLIGNKIADKIISHSETSKEIHLQNNLKEAKNEIQIPNKRYISPEKGQQIIYELRLV